MADPFRDSQSSWVLARRAARHIFTDDSGPRAADDGVTVEVSGTRRCLDQVRVPAMLPTRGTRNMNSNTNFNDRMPYAA